MLAAGSPAGLWGGGVESGRPMCVRPARVPCCSACKEREAVRRSTSCAVFSAAKSSLNTTGAGVEGGGCDGALPSSTPELAATAAGCTRRRRGLRVAAVWLARMRTPVDERCTGCRCCCCCCCGLEAALGRRCVWATVGMGAVWAKADCAGEGTPTAHAAETWVGVTRVTAAEGPVTAPRRVCVLRAGAEAGRIDRRATSGALGTEAGCGGELGRCADCVANSSLEAAPLMSCVTLEWRQVELGWPCGWLRKLSTLGCTTARPELWGVKCAMTDGKRQRIGCCVCLDWQ